jgi:hypothetical protein
VNEAASHPELAGVVENVKSACGEELISVIACGEAARSALASAIELLLIFRTITPEVVAKLRAYRTRQRRFPVELRLFTRDEFASSLDVFPGETLEILRCHKVLHGEDVIAGVNVEVRHLRHQLEFELRSKKQLVLNALLTEEEGAPGIGELVLAFARDFMRLGRHYLFMKGQKVIEPDSLLEQLGKDPGIATDVLRTLGRIAAGEHKPAASEKRALLWSFLDQVDKLIVAIDRTEGTWNA